MRCAYPRTDGEKVFGCGQCMPCRINRRRVWTTRCLLEAMFHPASMFVTLTYADSCVPRGTSPHPELLKKDLQDFLKRLRYYLAPRKVRFFAVGEYGSRTWRPHYHAIIFNAQGNTAMVGKQIMHFGDAREVAKAWPLGHVSVSQLTPERVAYCAQYTAKKMTRADDERLEDRPPEFMLSSRRPGIGFTDDVLNYLVSCYQTDSGVLRIEETGDVEGVVRIGGRVMPLGYALTQKLRQALDMPDRASRRPSKPPYWTPEEVRWIKWKYSGFRGKMIPMPESIKHQMQIDAKALRRSHSHGKI